MPSIARLFIHSLKFIRPYNDKSINKHTYPFVIRKNHFCLHYVNVLNVDQYFENEKKKQQASLSNSLLTDNTLHSSMQLNT